jgi:hypothetical protein
LGPHSKFLPVLLFSYKATVSNPRVHDEAKRHAEQMIVELEASHAKSLSGTAPPEHHDEHYHRVVGGLKAALKNENVKDETKAEIRQRLDEMGEQYVEAAAA